MFALICVGGFLTVASDVGEQQLNPVACCIKSPVTLVLQVEKTETVLYLCNERMGSILFQLLDLRCILLNSCVKPRSFYGATLTAGLRGGQVVTCL